jgi:hypothetical protein
MIRQRGHSAERLETLFHPRAPAPGGLRRWKRLQCEPARCGLRDALSRPYRAPRIDDNPGTLVANGKCFNKSRLKPQHALGRNTREGGRPRRSSARPDTRVCSAAVQRGPLAYTVVVVSDYCIEPRFIGVIGSFLNFPRRSLTRAPIIPSSISSAQAFGGRG